MAGMTTLPLQDFIASLDDTCLPKILQVCSGVYFQGSVYEMSGNEVCFSTGDLIKVLGIELVSVCCEDVKSNEKFELPITHKGLFKAVPDEMACSSIEEILSLKPTALDYYLPFTFISRSKIIIHNFILESGTVLTVLSVKHKQGEEDQVECCVQGQSVKVNIPISTKGDFVECEREECFTVQEIASLPFLRSRKYHFADTAKCERTFSLSPVFEIHAIMNSRRNELKFLSSLDMDVIDVTDRSEDVNVMNHISLMEVLSKPDECFPVVVKISEQPGSHSLFKCTWLSHLTKNQHLVLHKKEHSAMVLLSSQKSRRAQQHFLVLQQYNGQFRRRPREFHSVYELYVASLQAPGLTVTLTRSCDEDEMQDLPDLSVGEQLEIAHLDRMEVPYDEAKGQNQFIEVLSCYRIQEADDDDDDEEESVDTKTVKKEKIFLPLYMQVHSVEALKDTKKYRLRDLGQKFSLPLDVKVVTRDPELESDPLFGLTSVRIERAMSEPTLLASFPHKPECCFRIPLQWLSMSVLLTNDPLPWPQGQPPKCQIEKVTEVSDTFHYELLKQDTLDTPPPPPPRPPKRIQSSSPAPKRKSSKPSKKLDRANKPKQQEEKSAPTEKFGHLSLNADDNDKAPPLQPRKRLDAEHKAQPNTYTKMKQSRSNVPPCDDDDDDSHDYETIDDSLVAIKRAQELSMFY